LYLKEKRRGIKRKMARMAGRVGGMEYKCWQRMPVRKARLMEISK
jgi:hypothetical protein